MRAIHPIIVSVLIILSCWSIGDSAQAQDVPNSVTPGTLGKPFESVPEALSDGRIIVPPPAEQRAPRRAEQIRFKLNGVSLRGNTVFSDADL